MTMVRRSGNNVQRRALSQASQASQTMEFASATHIRVVLCDWSPARGSREVAVLVAEASLGLPERLEFKLVTRATLAAAMLQQQVLLACVDSTAHAELERWASARLSRDKTICMAAWPGGCLFASALEADGTLICIWTPPLAQQQQQQRQQQYQQQHYQQEHQQRQAAASHLQPHASTSPCTPAVRTMPPRTQPQRTAPARPSRWELACDSALEMAQEQHEVRKVRWEETAQLLRLQSKIAALQADAEHFGACLRKGGHPQGAAAFNTLLHKLLDAQPRVITLLTGGTLTDATLHERVATLHQDVKRALQAYERHVAGVAVDWNEALGPELGRSPMISHDLRQLGRGASGGACAGGPQWGGARAQPRTGARPSAPAGPPSKKSPSAPKALAKPPPPPTQEELVFKQHPPHFVWL